MPTPPNKTQAKRPLTAKELRAVRKRRREREKRDRKAQGIRPLWSLPTGQPVRRNYILSQALLPFACAALAYRCWRWHAPPAIAIITGVSFWLVFTVYIAWSARKAWPY